MWELSQEKIGIKLPKDFSLKEDRHFVYLLFRGKQVVVFSSSGISPEEIEFTAERYLREEEDKL